MKTAKRPVRAIFLTTVAIVALATGIVIGATIISAITSFSAEALCIGPDA